MEILNIRWTKEREEELAALRTRIEEQQDAIKRLNKENKHLQEVIQQWRVTIDELRARVEELEGGE